MEDKKYPVFSRSSTSESFVEAETCNPFNGFCRFSLDHSRHGGANLGFGSHCRH